MKGSHRIIVESRKIKYDFTIKRNITILTGTSGKLYRQQRICQLGKIFYVSVGEPDTGQSALGIFQEKTAGCIFIFKDNKFRKKSDEINCVE